MKNKYTALFGILLLWNLNSFAQTISFPYTGTVQTWVVPAGVTTIGVQAQGATGGLNADETTTACSPPHDDRFGYGACINATLSVTPGQTLNIYVGGKGGDGVLTLGSCTSTPGTGGYNGGGDGGYGGVGYATWSGGAGGGASDIRVGGVALANRVIVAAGGGGAGGDCYYTVDEARGGDGGTLTGETGYWCASTGSLYPGGGGGPLSGGAGGVYPGYGTGTGGTAGVGGTAGLPSGGGGGGGGWWGGGGGSWGGGGGGSSYADPTLTTAVTQTRGCNTTGNGSVVICLTNPGIITGAKPVCIGQPLTLTESIAGGTWTSSNTALATVGSSTGIVTGKSGGSVSISYTIATPCATVYAVATITVISSPLPIAGTDSVCVGSVVALSDATSGGAWSSSNTAVATVTVTGFVAGIYPGVATITYSIPPAGCATVLPVKVDGIAGPTKVCAGSTVTLVASNGGGMWTSSNTAAATIDTSGVVTGLSIGTSIISYSSLACPEQIVMTVNPIAPVIGADSVCVGGAAYFTDIVGIGSWSSSNPAVAIVSTGPGLVSGVSSGTSIISFVSPAGCMAKDTVNIIGLPKIVTGVLHVCPGTSVTLADSTPGGVWSTNNTSVATAGPGGVITGVNADTTSVFYTIKPGCTVGAVVLVNPLPLPITGRDTLCPGVIDTLHDGSINGLWSSTTPLYDTIVDTNGIVTSRLSGYGIVNYTLPTGCTISKVLYIYPVPVPVITYNQTTNTFYAPLGYPGYQWYDSISGKIPLANSPSLAGIYTQWYYVVITDTNGCQSASAVDHFNLDILNVNNAAKTEISIYPNPVTGMVYIAAPVNVRAVMSAINGKTVIDQSNARELDVSRLAAGAYLISLYDDSGQVLITKKLIKE